jgi:5-methyltetrahydrofolate--homocysteine methyltransferase
MVIGFGERRIGRVNWSSMAEALYGGRVEEVASLTRQALEEGHTPREVLKEGLLAGMEKVGRDMREEILFLPEVLLAAKAMHAAMEVLRPLLSEGGSAGLGKLVIGTVLGDIHDIGKNLVAMMVQGAGVEVVDLGIDVPPDSFVKAISEHRPQVLGLSALLTTTVDNMERTIEAVEEAGVREGLRIMVGGAPVTPEFAEKIGADGYAPDAPSAVELATSWLQS